MGVKSGLSVISYNSYYKIIKRVIKPLDVTRRSMSYLFD